MAVLEIFIQPAEFALTPNRHSAAPRPDLTFASTDPSLIHGETRGGLPFAVLPLAKGGFFSWEVGDCPPVSATSPVPYRTHDYRGSQGLFPGWSGVAFSLRNSTSSTVPLATNIALFPPYST